MPDDDILANCTACHEPITWRQGITTHVERDGETVTCRHFSGRIGRDECPGNAEGGEL